MSAPPSAPVATPLELEQRVAIETPEQVVFSYSVAGVGSRGAAALVDHLLIAITELLIWIGFFLVVGGVSLTPSATGGSTVGWMAALLAIISFAFLWGYFVYFEAVWDGQTPGKRLLHIRVVQDGGYSVSFAASAIRNLARLVDMQPGLSYGVGIMSAGLSKSGKRLGDMMAGTFVVQERVVRHAQPVASPTGDSATPAMLSAALTADEYDVLHRFVERRATLEPELRRRLGEQLATRFSGALVGIEGSDMPRLLELHARETGARARGVAARGAVGAAREQQAIVARDAGSWHAFAGELAEAQRRGLRSLSEDEISHFVARYREVATDLARLTTAAQGREVESLFYLSRLVGAAHNLFYRKRPLTGRAIATFFLSVVPRELRRSLVYILAAALCMFGPMAVTYHAVMTDPATAERLLPAGMIDRANEGVARAQRGDHAYIPLSSFERPVMASSIIQNNVQVVFAVFAFGITAGILTVLMLLLNGVSIGAALGLYASRGIFSQIGEFVVPHSVFELSAICIAGGGGLLLASALLLPGALTRREALVVKGRRAVRLLAASVIMLVLAGTIEGLISPRTDIPLGIKFGIAGLSALALLSYASLGGRGAADTEVAEEFGYSDERALISR